MGKAQESAGAALMELEALAMVTPPLGRRKRLLFDREITDTWTEARALREIVDGRHYRQTHPTFDSYCREVLRCSRTHAYRLIKALEVAEILGAA